MNFCGLVTLIVAPLSMPAVIAAETNPVADSAHISAPALAADTVRLKVEGMTCGGCAVSARIVLQRLDGVLKADVDYDTRIAVVVFDAKRVSPQRMIQALREKLKYTASVVPREKVQK